MKDVTVELNVQEMGIIISALQNLENADELRLSHEYGSVSALITDSTHSGSKWTGQKLAYAMMSCRPSDL